MAPRRTRNPNTLNVIVREIIPATLSRCFLHMTISLLRNFDPPDSTLLHRSAIAAPLWQTEQSKKLLTA